MRFLDLLGMSINNLRRRKLRTALTVLGVIIGTASVVVMVSLGIGLNGLMMEMYSSYGSMTSIDIYSGGGRYYASSSSGSSGSEEEQYITDDTIEQFKRLEHVKTASPILQTDIILKQGLYEAGVNIEGVSREYLEDIPLGQGALPDPGSDELKFIYGNGIIRWFSNSKTGEGFWEIGEMPPVDYMNKPMFVIFDTSAYYQSRYPGGSDGGNTVKPPKKYMIEAAGVVEGGVDDYNNYTYSVYAEIEALKAQLKRIYRKNPIPGQPTNKKGKPYPYFIYNRAVVFVDDTANVTTVQQMITDMGFQANSQMEWIEQSQQTYDIIQLVLGGIGAISLFVAAIGIANPLGEDFSVMRTLSLHGMLTSLATNYNRRNKNVRLYELGNIYVPKALPLTELPDERMQFTLGMYGDGDFFTMKGVIEEFFDSIGLCGKLTYDPNAGRNFLHPGRQANVVYKGCVLGYLGEVHPEVCDNYDMKTRAYVAVLDMPSVMPHATFDRKYEGIAKYPAVMRDISMVVPKEIMVGQIEDVIAQRGGKILEDYQLFDIYEGDQIKAGYKSVAYSITFRAKDRTLEEADITAAMKKILNGLEGMGIELRS